MDEWKILLADLDDDYLVGMANKGIVKRAYKDMEAGDYKVLSADKTAEVVVGEENVTIKQPLGESSCSCPSRTICRHVVLGILALKQYIADHNGGGTDQSQKETEKADENLSEQETTNQKQTDDFEKAVEKPAAEKQNLPEKADGDQEKEKSEQQKADNEEEQSDNAVKIKSATENKKSEAKTKKSTDSAAKKKTEVLSEKSGKKQDLKSRLVAEIAAYPLDSLKKTLGVKRLSSVINQIKSEQKPEITYSSIVTVKLKEGYTVKLLSPLDYSTCTCHKKEFCVHKAEAVLWCKITTENVSEDEINIAEEAQQYEMDQVKEAVGQMKVFLRELLGTGLARVSPDVLGYLDRLAIISHNAKLANFEGYWRALHDSYENYLGRKASFRTNVLMEQFARLYKRVELLEKSTSIVQVAKLAGEFRSEYAPAGTLDLTGIAMEHFESQTGYEGETVYFLEKNTKKWYTYTSARPVFYENSGRGRQEKAAAPWGLPVSIKELVGLRIHLYGVRCDERGRLSASSETKGEVTGNCKKENCLHTKEFGTWYYRDFGKLFVEQIGRTQVPWLKENREERRDGKLVLLRPYSFTKAEFSETEQKLEMWLYDASGREVLLELAYSKNEEWGIGYLERLTEDKKPYFLGKLYFRDGRIRLYPVTVFEGQAEEIFEDPEENENEGKAKKEAAKENIQKTDCETIEEENREETVKAVGQVLSDAGERMEELYQSGLNTVHDSTLEGLQNMTKIAEQYGLERLSELFGELADKAEMRRHQIKQEEDHLAAVYAQVCEYLYLCRQKVMYDEGAWYYREVL